MSVVQSWTVWIDANGQQTVRSLTAQSSTAAVVSALESFSNAVALSFAEGPLVSPGASPGTGAYLSARQVAYLRFTDGAGHVAVVALPSPKSNIFMSDGVTVDPTAIAPLIAACVGVIQTGAGTLVTAFQSGSLGEGSVNN